ISNSCGFLRTGSNSCGVSVGWNQHQAYVTQRLRAATNSCGKERKPAPQCRQSYQFPPAVASAKCLRSTSSSIPGLGTEPASTYRVAQSFGGSDLGCLGNHHC